MSVQRQRCPVSSSPRLYPYRFGVSDTDYPYLRERIMAHAAIWKDNQSEGSSTYFLDPDGHKIEIHVGSLGSGLIARR
ncbi:glutathione transferase fosa [Gluconobacter frateurii NBRC 103465]|nr:glutathione transferase fosa [Gluconobacter frateurii NBRC 103465]